MTQTSTVLISSSYNPKMDSTYMSKEMLNYFQEKLMTWKKSLVHEQQELTANLQELNTREVDLVDQGSVTELRYSQDAVLEQENTVLQEINQALDRIQNNTYGYCEITKEPIGVARLEAYPCARLTKDAQEETEQ